MKRVQLFALTLQALHQGGTTLDLVRRNVGLFVHPLMHRRELMTVFHRIYKWLSSIGKHTVSAWPVHITDELVSAACLLPYAVSHLKWPVSFRFKATDATPESGGSVNTWVSDHRE